MKWWKGDWVTPPAVFLAVFCLMIVMFYIAGCHAPPPSPEQKEKMAEVSVLHADRMNGTTVIVEVHERRRLGLLVNRKKDIFCWTASHIVREIGVGGRAVFRCTGSDGTNMSLRGVVILYDEGEGVALLRFAIPQGMTVDLPSVNFLGSIERPQKGERVSHTYALPERQPAFSEGVIPEVNRRYADMQYDVIACRVARGSSGGGIFRANGQCLGIVSPGRSWRGVLIIPARRVHALAERKGIPWASDLSIPMP